MMDIYLRPDPSNDQRWAILISDVGLSPASIGSFRGNIVDYNRLLRQVVKNKQDQAAAIIRKQPVFRWVASQTPGVSQISRKAHKPTAKEQKKHGLKRGETLVGISFTFLTRERAVLFKLSWETAGVGLTPYK